MKQSIARPGTILTTIAVQVLLAGSVADASPIRIRPLGHSITDSANVAGGYRGPLYTLLTNVGFQVDFVGTQKNNGIGGLPDFDHEGHSGYRIDQIDGGLLGYFGQIWTRT